jgi:hypothetical protein
MRFANLEYNRICEATHPALKDASHLFPFGSSAIGLQFLPRAAYRCIQGDARTDHCCADIAASPPETATVSQACVSPAARRNFAERRRRQQTRCRAVPCSLGIDAFATIIRFQILIFRVLHSTSHHAGYHKVEPLLSVTSPPPPPPMLCAMHATPRVQDPGIKIH